MLVALIDNILVSIRDRLDCLKNINYFSIFNFREIISLNNNLLNDYGVEHIPILIKKMKNVCFDIKINLLFNETDFTNQYSQFKNYLK